MKKILLLGGSEQQIIAIKVAKKMGYYTIVCDYLSDNPGQYIADKFFLVSTTDKRAVLDIARTERIDGILAYASDPAAPTAAYVAQQLELPGNPYESVEILCNKDKFRDFLSKNGFFTPKACGYSSCEKALDDLKENLFKFPVIVKPVDSSGSKGVAKVDKLDDARKTILNAISFSRRKRFIIEEFVEKKGYQIAGDGLSIDGELVFRYFGNDHFDSRCENPFVPIAASFPYNMPIEVHNKIHDEIQRLLKLLNMRTCTYNFDIRIDDDENVYLMEIAPRDGGNYIPDVIKYATGMDLIECSVKAAMGEKIEIQHSNSQGFYSYYSVHSSADGVLNAIDFSAEGEAHIIESHIIKQPGDEVLAYRGSNTTLGCLIMKFESMNQMLHMMDHSEEWIDVKLKEGIQ